jgi:DNA-binding NarL/FixJ family response regulator
MTYHIVIADDHPLIRHGIRQILSDVGDLEVVAEAADGQMLLDLLAAGALPDLIIIDISMPKIDGLEAIRQIKLLHPGINTLVVTMHKERDYIMRALDVGTAGYLVKENADAELVGAIDRIRQGEVYISPCLSQALQATPPPRSCPKPRE